MENKEIFTALNAINVNDKTEKKNGLTYLSWAWAWAEVKKIVPDASYTIYERQTEYGPVNYFTDGRTCWVKTGVTLDGLEHIEELPVMDYKNRSIPLENVVSTDVNKAIQRSLTKACARHGLGLYIYAGEDLPEADADAAKAKKEKRDAEIAAEEAAYNDPEPVRCNHCGSVILRATGKDGVVKEPEEIKEACGGLCPVCYREQRKRTNEGENQ